MELEEPFSLSSLKPGDRADVSFCKLSGKWGRWLIWKVVKNEPTQILFQRVSFMPLHENSDEYERPLMSLNIKLGAESHPQVRKYNTYTPIHYDQRCCWINVHVREYGTHCLICDNHVCRMCNAINIVSISKKLVYHCKSCEYSRRYNEAFKIGNSMYKSIFFGEIIGEINIIHLITKYSMTHQNDCYSKINETINSWQCKEDFICKLDMENHMEIDKDINIKIEGILCGGCCTEKRRQYTGACKVYHEYDGNEQYECLGCHQIVCNRCLNVSNVAFQACLKWGGYYCSDCDPDKKNYVFGDSSSSGSGNLFGDDSDSD